MTPTGLVYMQYILGPSMDPVVLHNPTSTHVMQKLQSRLPRPPSYIWWDALQGSAVDAERTIEAL